MIYEEEYFCCCSTVCGTSLKEVEKAKIGFRARMVDGFDTTGKSCSSLWANDKLAQNLCYVGSFPLSALHLGYTSPGCNKEDAFTWMKLMQSLDLWMIGEDNCATMWTHTTIEI
ncbi:hypothetical protein ANTQUA_LOCUS5393 [Anthophora quadrimaculata]